LVRRGHSGTLLAIGGAALTTAVGLLGNIVSGEAPGWVPFWVWLLLFALCLVLAAVVEVREHRPGEQPPNYRDAVDAAATDLHGAAKKQWNEEAGRLGLNSAERRLPIRWTDHDSDPAVTRDGHVELARLWLHEVKSRRLVLLGTLGSGKTELLYRLLSHLLDRGQPDGAVPVLVPAASWDPATHTFAAWVADWLATNYSFLSPQAPGPTRRTLAEALWDEGRLAIVLDGLDELPPALARTAVRRLSAELQPTQYLLVSSRPAEYADAVSEGRLEGAVAVTLDPQDPAVVLGYLRGRSHGQASRWDDVAAAMTRAEPISEVLQTPLMVTLADDLYNRRAGQSGDRGPAELLALGRSSIEDQLLDDFVELRYRDASRWPLRDVRHWLGGLAEASRKRADSTNLAWWDLPMPEFSDRSRRLGRYLVTPLIVLIWTAISAAVMYSLLLNDPNRGVTNAIRISLAAAVMYAALQYLSRSYEAALLAALLPVSAGPRSGWCAPDWPMPSWSACWPLRFRSQSASPTC
jgi:hypothetical protein